MRILHVVSTLAAGGIASSLAYALPVLADLPGVQVEIATLYTKGHFGDRLSGRGLPVHEVHLGRKYAPQALPRLRALVRRGNYDLVHVHGWPGLLFLALTPAPGLGYVYSEHNVTNRRRRPIFRLLDRLLYKRYTGVVAVSARVASALVAWLPETQPKVCVVHNGVDPSLFQQPPETRERTRACLNVAADVPLLLFAGSLDQQKGIDVLLRALSAPVLTAQGQQPLLLVCGEGLLHSALADQVTALGLDAQVRFLGYRPDVPEWMAAADLFVLPSRWEGCPMVLLEAMASGLPLVATPVGGVPELIKEGVHGRLVPAEDAAALAQAIAWTIEHPAQAGEMAARARARVLSEFSAEATAHKLLAVYRDMLE